jgi:hypothetical protein
VKLIQGQDLISVLARQVSLQPTKPVKMCTLEWDYLGLVSPSQAMAIARASVCIGWGNTERVKKLAVGARLPGAALNLRDRLALLPSWPQRHAGGGSSPRAGSARLSAVSGAERGPAALPVPAARQLGLRHRVKGKIESWVDTPRFTFGEVVSLTGCGAPYLHALRLRGHWTPRLKQPHGGPMVRRTYTARDLLHVMVIAPALATNTQLPAGDAGGASPALLGALVRALDAVIDGKAAPGEFVVPRYGSAWCSVRFDLGLLVKTQLARLGREADLQDTPSSWGVERSTPKKLA